MEEIHNEESSCITQRWDCAVEGSPSCTAEVGCCAVAVGCCTEERNGVSCTKRTADCFGALEDNYHCWRPEGGAVSTLDTACFCVTVGHSYTCRA